MPTPDNAPVKTTNPFAVLAVQDGDHADDLVDIALHEPARQALERGRNRVRSGHSHVTALIGAEGSGKSHLLWWLRRQNANPIGLFVMMPALPDLAQPFRHALRQLVSALCRKSSISGVPSDSSSPFERPIDRLLWEMLYVQTLDLLDAARISMYQGPAALLKLVGPLCLEAGRRRPLADFAKAAQAVWPQVEPGLRAYLLSLPTEAAIDSAARAVLVQYPYSDRRALCTAWLAGEDLGPKERERISAKQVINNESAAKYVLCALCRLLTARPGQERGAPLVIAYDQTDQVAQQLGHPGVHAMAEVIVAIQLNGGAVLQVLSCRPESWNLLHQKLDRTGSSQLKQLDDTLKLGPIEAPLLRELVTARAGQSVMLTSADLDPQSWPKELSTPREALTYILLRQQAAQQGGVPIPATDAPTARGLPSTPLRAPVKAPPAAAAKVTPAPAAAKKDAASRPGSAAKKDVPSVPAKAPAPVSVKKEEPAPAAPLSNQSPTVAWLVMAGDEDPMAAALNKVDSSESKVTVNSSPAPPLSKPAAKVEAKAPAAKAPTSRPAATPAPVATAAKKPLSSPKPAAKSAAPAASAISPSLGWLSEGKAEAAKPAAPTKSPAPAPPPAADPEPSAQSPSVTWMAMASEDDPLAQALAAVDRQDAAAAASTSGKPPRTTKERLPPVESPRGGSLTAPQVLAAMGSRERVEEWLLAKELGVAIATLSTPLSQLEDQGAVRLLTIGDGQRMVARLGR